MRRRHLEAGGILSNVNPVNRLRLTRAWLPVAAAAILGNAFISRDSMAWFQALRLSDGRSYRLAIVVLAGNEMWNALLFGRRSPRDGFLGILAFLLPLGLLQVAVTKDRPSRAAVGAYATWVVFYDIPWTYQLWRLNA